MSTEPGWRTYQDFVLKIEHAGEGQYRVEADAPGGGKAQATFELPFDAVRLENFMLKVGHPRRIPTRGHVPDEMQPAIEFGQQLYHAVVCDEVRDLFVRASRDAEGEDQGMRLQLRLADAPELCDIPWEFLNDGRDFLALSAETPIVRYLDLPNAPRPMAVDPPLRILVTISAPHGMPALDTEAEKAKLLEALAALQERGAVTVDFTPDATLQTLENALLRAQSEGRPYHVWHYVGHGAYVESREASVLAFADDANQLHRVGDLELGTLFDEYPEIRLVLLNACEGARPDPQDPFAGVAAALVRRGVPAVIGMQFEVSDEAAITLSKAFYTSLALGFPVDAALAKARRAVFFMPNWAEWATPVLYMRAPDGRLFEVSPPVLRPDLTEPTRAKELPPVQPAPRGVEPEASVGRERRSWPTWGWIVLVLVLPVAFGIIPEDGFIRKLVSSPTSPAPTHTPAPAPTHTPAPAPTHTPAPAPTHTLAPAPTHTPTPPTDTPVPSNTPQPTAIPLEWAREGDPQLDNRLGKASDEDHSDDDHDAVWQIFDNGYMLWRANKYKDEDQWIYVLYNTGRWEVYKDEWKQESDDKSTWYSCPDDETPSQSPPTPWRGFGKVWCRPGVREGLGSGWSEESSIGLQHVQNFENGVRFRAWALVGEEGKEVVEESDFYLVFPPDHPWEEW